jgi:hypothetical protein
MNRYYFSYKSTFIVIIAAFIFMPLSPRAQIDSNGFINGYDYVRYFYHDDIQPFDASFSIANSFWNDRLEHNFMLGGLSLVKQGRHARYSFKLPVSMLTMGLTYGLNAVFLNKKHRNDGSPSPFYYILTLPNSIWNLKIINNFQLCAGVQTDYLFYRDHRLDRGILITPVAGITWYPDEQTGGGSVNISGGYANLWNFDGPDKSYGWGINFILILWD